MDSSASVAIPARRNTRSRARWRDRLGAALSSDSFRVVALSLAANLFVFGQFLGPTLTIAPSAYTPTVMRHCRASGPGLACAQDFSPSILNDAGAPAWVEMADDYYLQRARLRGEPSPSWNPFSGSGYPVALDGHGGRLSPTRWLLSLHPGEQGRDVLVFARLLLYTTGVLTALALAGAGVGVLAPAALVAALSPYGTAVLDHVMLDVDLLSPWFLALLVALATGRLRARAGFGIALVLGLLVGSLGFQQSQVTACATAGVLSLVAIPATRGRSIALGAAMALGFLLMGSSWLPLVQHLDQFISSRNVQCIVEKGQGLETLLPGLLDPAALSVTGPALTGAGLILLPFAPRPFRFALAALLVLGTWLILGLPRAACSVPLLSGVRFSRHLAIHVQTLAVFGVGVAAQSLAAAAGSGWKRLAVAAVGILSLQIAFHTVVPLAGPLLQATVIALGVAAAALVAAWRRPLLRGSPLLVASLGVALVTMALAPLTIASKFAVAFWTGRAGAVELPPLPLRLWPTTAMGAVQYLSELQDRRHYSPAGDLYPNASASLGILDLLSLSALYPIGYHELNAGLFAGWEHDPAHGLVPDRFVPVAEPLAMSEDFQRVLIVNRVSLLTFQPNAAHLASTGSPYAASLCQLLARTPAQWVESWICPAMGGVGFFPKHVEIARSRSEALEILKSRTLSQLVDMAVLGPEIDPTLEAQGLARPTAGRVVAVDRRGDDLTYSLEAEQAGVFVVADTWFSGWSATVNGEPVPISRANVAFKAVRIPAGRVVVRFHFSL